MDNITPDDSNPFGSYRNSSQEASESTSGESEGRIPQAPESPIMAPRSSYKEEVPLQEPSRAPDQGNILQEMLLKLLTERQMIKTPMPGPDQVNSIHFGGKNITRFLERWEDLCRDHLVSEEEQIERVPRYMDEAIGDYVKSLPTWKERRWEDLKRILIKEFKSNDWDYSTKSKDFLQSIKDKAASESKDLQAQLQYCRLYRAKSEMITAGLLDDVTRGQWFLQGLRQDFQKKVFHKCRLDLDDPSTFQDFGKICDHAIEMIKAAISFESLNGRGDQKEWTRAVDSYLGKPDKSKTISNGVAVIKPTKDASEPLSKSTDQLVQAMKDLSIRLGSLESQNSRVPSSTTTVRSQTKQAEAMGNPITTAWASPGRTDQASPPIRRNPMQRCIAAPVCGAGNHPRSQCEAIKKWTEEGKLHMKRSDGNHLYFGREGENGAKIPLQLGFKQPSPGLQIQDAIKAAEVSQNNATLVEEVFDPNVQEEGVSFCQHSISWDDTYERDLGLDLDSEEEQDDQVVIAAAQSILRKRQGERNVLTPNQSDHRVQKARSQATKDSDVAGVRGLRAGTYPLVAKPLETLQDQRERPITMRVNAQTSDQVMDDRTTPAPTRVPKQKKTERLDYHLQRDFEPSKYVDGILGSQISVSLSQLLVASPDLRRAVFQRYPIVSESDQGIRSSRAAIDEDLQGLNVCNVSLDQDGEPFLSVREEFATVGSPHVEALVGADQTPVSTLLDTGAEANIMSLQKARSLRLPWSSIPPIKLQGAQKQGGHLVGFAPRVPIKIGTVTTHQMFLLSDTDSTKVILGRPFERSARLSSENLDDGSWEGSIWSADGKTTTTFTAVLPRGEKTHTIRDFLATRGHPNVMVGLQPAGGPQ